MISAVSAALLDSRFGVPGILGVEALTIGGSTVDITPTARQVPILGTITPTIN